MPIVGLNLGKSSFRAVELDRKKDKVVLNKFGIYENPRLNLESDNKDDLNQFADALKNFFTEVGFSTPEVIVGLNESNVYMRVIKMPVMSDKELKASIRFEAEQYIPIPINEVNLSHQKLEVDFADNSKMDVQVVAAKTAILNKYVDLLRRAKLVTKAIEPETIALSRALGDTRESPVGTLILEMGLTASLIIVSYGGFVRFSRSIPVGGDIITRAIQQGLGLDLLQAEEYKKVYGMDQYQADGKVFQVIKPLIDNLILEINRASLFFTNHNPSATIKRIILTGGTALMPGLLLYIAKNLDYEVELANPVKNVVLNPRLEDQKNTLVQQGPLYSTAFGLGLRAFVK